MTLSNREKKLLILLGIVIGIYIIYTFLVSPMLDQYDNVTQENKELIQEKKELQDNLVAEDEVNKIIDEYQLKIEELSVKLPPVIHQEWAMNLLFDIYEANDIDVSSYGYSYSSETPQYDKEQQSTVELLNNFEEGTIENLDDYISNDTTAEGANGEAKPVDTKALSSFNVNVSYKAEYNDFKKLLIALEENESEIIIKNVSMSRFSDSEEEETINMISGNLSLQMPYFYDNEQIDDVQFVLTSEQIGKFNPFISYTEEQVVTLPPEDNRPAEPEPEEPAEQPIEEPQEPEQPPEEETTLTADFTMELSSFSNSLPTIAINKAPYKYTSLFTDSNEFKTIDLIIQEINGLFYFKYSNEYQTFPAGNLMQFDPKNDNSILLEVFSELRTDENDNAGVILKLDNKTNRTVDIHVYNDDEEKPRLRIQSISGNYRKINN